ncbi:hypothetical protein TSUD_115150 [Trifolium subterraneum]|uniref:Uncharacterized protein n=1 Tax=Trifolium subterraneum TaxID=3900 RepID=A0A2Z6PKZ1_TRISU|nr:hypothetical protein TSUD_115150 [Trifolium subterraneum]
MESEDDDWEICYDDGFVYKRKRRRLNPPEPVTSSEPDSEKLRKERKKQTLLKLKSKYENEIVEAQEAIIHDISNLCDVAEAMCFKQEQLSKQSLFDLPIWSTPHELMQVLCYDD